MQISAIICTHNPREACLQRVLESLRTQTLPIGDWELLLIDNASDSPLSSKYDLSWQPQGRHVREEELGLTPARLRGIREAEGDVLVFVDDDTVLAPNYFEQALAVGKDWPFIGVWGGNIDPEFETPPPDWCLRQPWRLTIDPVKTEVWSNLREGFATIPAGAGMCLRKEVGQRFIEWCKLNEKSKGLDRKGTALTGYGDVDLAHCAMDIGLGTGKSPRLQLTHLIPSTRLTLDYLVRHAESDAASLSMFREMRGLPVKEPRVSLTRMMRWHLYCLLSNTPREIFEIDKAHQRGLKKGWEMVKKYRETRQPSPADNSYEQVR